VAAVALLAALALPKLPVLLGLGVTAAAREVRKLPPLTLPGSTLFLSDLQLKSPQTRFPVTLPQGLAAVVLLGDLFEAPRYYYRLFGATEAERIGRALETFLPEGFDGEVYFISARSHDPALPTSELLLGKVRFRHLGRYARFALGHLEVVATHGDLFFNGYVGGLVSWAAGLVGYPLPLERLGKRRLGLPQGTWLFTAHSHVPAISQGARVANTGSLAGVPFNFFFRIPTRTGLLVDQEGVRLVHL